MNFFKPQSIAVIGASADRHKIGAAMFSNLINAGFQGRVFPVNPKYKTLHGAKCYNSVSEIDEEVEMVLIAIPAKHVIPAVQEAIEKNVKYAIVISAGFSETGPEGLKLERELSEVVKGSDLRLLGPNCLGIIAPHLRVNASFAAHMPKIGNIAFLSQSGAFNTALLDMAAKAKLGFSHFVSMGNKIDLNEVDFLQQWLHDDNVEVIGMYLEEFDNGRELIEIAQTAKKPIVILHPGQSKAAQAAIASHTGSLADEAEVVHSALRKGNIVQVDNIEKMFNALEFFSINNNRNYGRRIAVVTNAGGPGVIATDLISEKGLDIVDFSVGLQGYLSTQLPSSASVHNPVDLLGDARADRYAFALDALVDNQEVDTIVTVLTPQYMTEIEETAEIIVDKLKHTNKMIFPVFIGGKDTDEGLKIIREAGFTAYSQLNDGINALASAINWQEGKFADKHSIKPGVFTPLSKFLDLTDFVSDEEKPLPYYLSRQLAEQVGLFLPAEILTNQAEEAVKFADSVGYPVVVKATTEQIVHKTDKKALYLNLNTPEDVTNAVHWLQGMLYEEAGIEKATVLVQEQLEFSGQELIMGIKRSNSFGPLMLFGAGGIYTEVFQDAASVIVPANHEELVDLINSTRVSQIIHGARTGKELAFDKAVQMLGQLQLLAMSYPSISAIDINPVILNQEVAIAADLKVFVKKGS